MKWRWANRTVAAVMLVFLYLPLAVIVAYSFNESRHSAQWSGFTTKWYRSLGENGVAMGAVKNSLIVAAASCAVSTLLGTALGYSLARRPSGRAMSFLQLQICLPDIVQAVALLLFFSFVHRWLNIFELGIGTMIVAHVTFQLPFVALVVKARAATLDPSWLEAARDLGATPGQAFRHVTLPLLAPGILAGAMLAFTLSLDDFVVSFFTGGAGSTTLPVLIYSSVKRGITPEIHALSTLLILAAAAGTIGVTLLQKSPTLPVEER